MYASWSECDRARKLMVLSDSPTREQRAACSWFVPRYQVASQAWRVLDSAYSVGMGLMRRRCAPWTVTKTKTKKKVRPISDPGRGLVTNHQ
jgi:hypothetical protein